jgi:hypothetical protein
MHEKGVGGFFYGKTAGGDMIFQNKRLHYLGRLAQEYALGQYSRQVEDTLAYQRNGKLQSVLKRRRDMSPARPGHEDRVGLTASVVGSRKCVPVVEKDCACSTCSAGSKAECLQQRRLAAVKKHMIPKCAVGACMACASAATARSPARTPRTTRAGTPSTSAAWATSLWCRTTQIRCSNMTSTLTWSSALAYRCTATCTGTVHCYMHKGQDTIRMVTNYVYKHLAGAGYNMCKPPQISPTDSLPGKRGASGVKSPARRGKGARDHTSI